MQIMRDNTARIGTSYLRASTNLVGGSVAIDFNLPITQNDWNDAFVAETPPGSIYTLAWVRAPDNAMVGDLTLWEIGDSAQNTQSVVRGFEVDNTDDWIMIENALDIVLYDGPLPSFRVEFYMNSERAHLDIDAVMVFE